MQPCIFKVDKPGIHADRLLLAHSLTVSFGSLQPFTVHKIGDFPHFLSALASNNQFIVKMWSGRTPHVMVGTLKVRLDRLILKREEFSTVLHVVSVAVNSA